VSAAQTKDVPAAASAAGLPGLDVQAHARTVLGPALPPAGSPSHAYLFHGPAGTGKRATARAFAAALLADGAADPAAAAARAQRGAHPDLTWVTRSGAAEMLVADIEEPVVAAAARTPFEAARRVFVIEAVETLNDQAANRLLKTLEEPASYVHLLLITERLTDVLPTIASRCLLVRFDPLPASRVAGLLQGVDGERALACARLAQGDAGLAARLADPGGEELRRSAQAFVGAALAGTTESRPWLALLERAQAAGAEEAARAQERTELELELLPAKERRRHEREASEARRRIERRARTETLDLGLRLVELWLRDLLCVREQAGELVLAVDRRDELQTEARDLASPRLREAIELVGDTRLSLALFVGEELALEALAYRLQALFAG
jgi:DNA polymerase-3 subunit delta'